MGACPGFRADPTTKPARAAGPNSSRRAFAALPGSWPSGSRSKTLQSGVRAKAVSRRPAPWAARPAERPPCRVRARRRPRAIGALARGQRSAASPRPNVGKVGGRTGLLTHTVGQGGSSAVRGRSPSRRGERRPETPSAAGTAAPLRTAPPSGRTRRAWPWGSSSSLLPSQVAGGAHASRNRSEGSVKVCTRSARPLFAGRPTPASPTPRLARMRRHRCRHRASLDAPTGSRLQQPPTDRTPRIVRQVM